MKHSSVAFTLACATLLSACASVTVSPVKDASTVGLRYWLPQPYLLMTPQADGSATYQWLYLPDSSQEYAVVMSSYFSTFKIDVQRDNGLLKSVALNMDSSAIAAKVESDVASVQAARKQADLTAQQAQRTQQQQNANTLLQAKIASDQAQIAVADMNANASAANPLSSAQLTAKIQADQARVQLQDLEKFASTGQAITGGVNAGGGSQSGKKSGDGGQGGNGAAGDGGGANGQGDKNANNAKPPADKATDGNQPGDSPAPANPADKKPGTPPPAADVPANGSTHDQVLGSGTRSVQGPVLFKLVQSKDAVSLVPVAFNKGTDEASKQPFFMTNRGTQLSSPPSGAPDQQATTKVQSATSSKIIVSVDRTVYEVKVGCQEASLERYDDNSQPKPFTTSKATLKFDQQASSTTIAMSFNPPLSSGNYSLTLCYSLTRDNKIPSNGTVMFTLP